ncbi:MAG: class I SAM-dependent RNA methyltransferase, partial [Chloroflexi bacterium]
MPDPETLDIDILSLVYGGDAMGRLPDGRAVFVPYALPGERVRIRLVEQKKGFARARLVKVLQPAPERIEPRCENFAACGGCHYMHIAYAAQLRYKTAILSDQLQRIAGLEDPPVQPMAASPKEWQYRNTVQFHLDRDGKPGYQEPGSHVVVPIQACPLCEPAIDEIWPNLDFSDPEQGPVPGLERIQLRAGADEEILVVIKSNDPTPPEFSVDLPISAVFVGPGGFEENEPLVLAGEDSLVMEA